MFCNTQRLLNFTWQESLDFGLRESSILKVSPRQTLRGVWVSSNPCGSIRMQREAQEIAQLFGMKKRNGERQTDKETEEGREIDRLNCTLELL